MNPIGRLSRDLRDMRWGQVAVELLLLVLGILIALAIDDWMQDRRDAQTERRNLEGIVRDLGRDLLVLEEFGAYHESQTADGVMVYRALRSEADVEDKDGVAHALSRLMSRRTLRLSHPTYSNLVGTGSISLVRNAELRDRIVGLYEANERWATIIDRNNLTFVDQMFAEYLLNSGLIAPRPTNSLQSLQKLDAQFDERIGIPIGVSNDALWRLGPSSPEREILANKVWYRSLISSRYRTQADEIARDVTAVRQAIVDELTRRWPEADVATSTG